MYEKVIITGAVIYLACSPVARSQDIKKAAASNIQASCTINSQTRSVEITLRNTTNEKVYFQKAGLIADYQLSLKDLAGAAIPTRLSKFSKSQNTRSRQLAPQMSSTDLIILAPQEEQKESIALDNWFVLSEGPGEYEISIMRKLSAMGDPNLVVKCSTTRVLVQSKAANK